MIEKTKWKPKWKVCTRCSTRKRIRYFALRRNGHVGSWCRKCANAYSRMYARTSEKNKRWRIEYRKTSGYRWAHSELYFKKTYGIDYEDWARRYERQESCCAGCGFQFDFAKPIHVDHNHTTGAVRGLLCTTCNLALGASKDSPGTLRKLADYLEVNDCFDYEGIDLGPNELDLWDQDAA